MAKSKLVVPFVKWVGGKRQLLDEIKSLLPKGITTYCEPFLGGGSVLFSIQPKVAFVNDLNQDLIAVYEVIRDDADALIASLSRHENTPEYFYAMRDLDRDKAEYAAMGKLERASRLLYLNKTCYNGLFRVNAAGEFNTPYGAYANPNLVNERTLRAVSKYLNENQIHFFSEDFEATLERIPEDSFVYLDPPYDPVSETSSFTSYHKDGFDKNMQLRLKACCDRLNERGIKFMLSNSATFFIKQQYQGYHINVVNAKRAINSVGSKRGEIEEVIITNYGEKRKGKNDDAWDKLFEKHDILQRIQQEDSFRISAGQIKVFREPRLMTKFDHRVNLPEIFSRFHLSILPVTTGDYVISDFLAYHRFEPDCAEVQRVTLPTQLQSLQPQFLVSEAVALNCACACGILSDFLEEKDLVATVNGRMRSGDFDFQIDTPRGRQTVGVHNAQIEIDGAYEGERCLALFEAKNDLSDDFLVRQLYYPYRAWSGKVSKPVRTVFLTFSNGEFHLREYCFRDANDYSSIELVKQKRYLLVTDEGEAKITAEVLRDLLLSAAIACEPEIPFPQANVLERVVNLVELLAEKSMSKQDISAAYDFDPRQAGYYADAGRYLGLIEKRGGGRSPLYALTQLGQRLVKMPFRQRRLTLAGQILKHRPFHEALKLRLQTGKLPGTQAVVRIMRACELYRVKSDETYLRRSSSILGWVKWIADLAEE